MQKPGPATNIPRPAFATHNSTASIASLSSSTAASLTNLSASTSSAPRFGSTATCPGCRIGVSPMEPGIVPGPGATKWHKPCLVCGGRKAASKRSSGVWTTKDDVKGPGCGKKLDSAAKGDVSEGILWCRDCWDMTRSMSSPLPPSSPATGIFPTSSSPRPNSALGISSTTLARQMTRGSGATSPLRRHFQASDSIAEGEGNDEHDEEADSLRPLSSAGHYLSGRSPSPVKLHFTGMSRSSSAGVRPQNTGFGAGAGAGLVRSGSPVRRQYTGMGAAASGAVEEAEPLTIQYTGGGVPITRQLSTAAPGSRRPRSGLGMRSLGSQKSIDEGRGMFLVRQMTGQGQMQRGGALEGVGEVEVSSQPI